MTAAGRVPGCAAAWRNVVNRAEVNCVAAWRTS